MLSEYSLEMDKRKPRARPTSCDCRFVVFHCLHLRTEPTLSAVTFHGIQYKYE